jgi:hypothetical protein
MASFSFLSFAGLWLLSLMPPIVLLYLLKRKREKRLVSSTLLWSEVRADLQASTPFQKLRKNLLLILQLVIIALLTLSIMRPVAVGQARGGESRILILDTSASMKARDCNGRSRFDLAREEAIEQVRTLMDGDRAMLIEAGRGARTIRTFTGRKEDLIRALETLVPKDTETDLEPALRLAAATLRALRGKAVVYLFSDGGSAPVPGLRELFKAMYFRRFGERADNLAVTMLEVRRSEADPERAEVFARVRNFYATEKTCYITFHYRDKLIDARELNLGPGASISEIFRVKLGEGSIRVEIDADDPLSVDNRAFAYLSARQSLSVLIVSAGNPALERVLGVDPTIRLHRVSPDAYQDEGGWDLVIFDGAVPRHLPAVPTLFINPPRSFGALHVGDVVEYPGIAGWEVEDRLLRYVDLSNVYLRRAKKLDLKGDGRVFIRSDEGPLLLGFAEGGVEYLVMPFDLYDTNWPLRLSFPIFFKNVTRWAFEGRGGPGKGSVLGLAGRISTGDTVPIRLPLGISTIRVVSPSGVVHELAGREGWAYFGETGTAGFYRVEAAGYTGIFAANLLSEEESDLTPRVLQVRESEAIRSAVSVQKVNVEIWRWFALAALVVAMVEWYAYQRRI